MRNNIVMRNLRKTDRALDSVGDQIWSHLDEVERQILAYMSGRTVVSRIELQNYLGRSNTYVSKYLTHMMELGAIKANGQKNDPKRTYSIIHKG